jgi:hypothetical protein
MFGIASGRLSQRRSLTPQRSGVRRRFPGRCAGLFLCAVLAPVAFAEPAPGATMHDALLAALQRVEGVPDKMPEVTAGWLAGPPTLAASYLGSDESRGTDETEIALSFPLKSPWQRRSDTELARVEPELDAALQRYRAWYLSGTLRELRNTYRVAAARLPTLERGVAVLRQVQEQLREQVDAGSAERFELLALQRAALDAREDLAALRNSLRRSRDQFASLTGFASIPGDAAVTAVPVQIDYAAHPQLQWTALSFRRELAALTSQSPEAAAWNIAIVGRELDTPALTEQQIGLAVELPLRFGGTAATTTTQSAVRSLHRDYLQQRDQLLQTLRQRWNEEMAQLEALRARRRDAAALLDTQDLESLLAATRESNELPVEIKLARLQSLLQAAAEEAVTAARIAASEERLRQLSGQVL